MKGLLWVIAVAGATLLLAPISANAAEYSTFVGCDDLDATPTPSNVCHIGDFPGAYFESDVDTEYEVCVEFPGGLELCAEEQFAEAGVLYVNSITTESEGNHFASWYVKGVKVGSWLFRMDPVPPPPPTPVLPPPPPLAPPAVTATSSVACLKAQQRVKKLKGQLGNAKTRAKKTALRAKLKKARSNVNLLCAAL
jgi:hypothetical protein